MNKTALITGATSGIGYELAYVHATQGGNVALVARSKDKLEQIKKDLEDNYKISAYVIEKDLSLKDSAKDVYDEIMNNNITVDYLINNAGFGDYGFFNDSDWGKLERMINLNITALTQLTKLFISDMIKRGNGKIMNVASTAAFQPGPTMAVYYATKAYVLSFSEAINNEVSGSGVTVTTLCPGPTKSGFQEAASLKESRLVKGRILATSKEVAEYGYNAMLKGKPVAIPGIVNYLIANSVRFFPRSAVLKMARFIQDKR
jgi:short-subunit dehydrogenase